MDILGQGGLNTLSLLAQYDEINRLDNILNDGQIEHYFLQFLRMQEKWQQQRLAAEAEATRLQKELQEALKAISVWEAKFTHARKLLDTEKRQRMKAEHDRDNLEKQMNLARELLFNNRANTINNETLEKLAFLNNTTLNNRLSAQVNNGKMSTITEMNSTGNLLSDASVSRSEDDLDESVVGRRSWIRHRPSAPPPPPPEEHPPNKKRRSSGSKEVHVATNGHLVATTTVTIENCPRKCSNNGRIVASSVIEANEKAQLDTQSSSSSDVLQTPKLSKDDFNIQIESKGKPGHYVTNIKKFAPSAPSATKIDSDNGWSGTPSLASSNAVCSPQRTPRLRQHTFTNKTIMKPDSCVTCGVKIRFAKTVAKCSDCRAICHVECKDKLPLPCIPSHITPNANPNQMGTISDYTPNVCPMVPALIIHCVNEIEARGMNEIGLYRVPGSEKEVRMLKEKFLRGRGTPPLNNTDINVICGCVKDFLRSLKEPLVTYSLWSDFVSATEMEDKSDIEPALYQAISELPQPNRDTLAFMILHLQRVADWVECKMPIMNLAKVFGPTIVGYSDNDPDPNYMYQQTRQQVNVMEHLMNISSDYWVRLIAASSNNGCGVTTTPLLQTPSFRSRAGTAPLTTPRRDTFSRNRHTPYYTPASSSKQTQQKGFFYTPGNSNKY